MWKFGKCSHKFGRKRRKNRLKLVKSTKANRFAFKTFGFIDNTWHQLYNLTIRTESVHLNCKKCPKIVTKKGIGEKRTVTRKQMRNGKAKAGYHES